MPLSPTDPFTAHLDKLLATVAEDDLRALLRAKVDATCRLADASSAQTRAALVDDFQALIEQRLKAEVK